MERDVSDMQVQRQGDISTHTLTWSVTIGTHAAGVAVTDFNSHAHVERDLRGNVHHLYYDISTHTLTWSVTILAILSAGMPEFQLTRSRGA